MDLLLVLTSLFAVLVSVLGLVVGLVVLTLVKSIVVERGEEETSPGPEIDHPVNLHTNGASKDTYTPDYAEGTVPLEHFTPNFSKPVKYTMKDDEEGHGLEETPEKDNT